MFKVLEKGGRTVPMICCDICKSWIDDVGLAAAVFESPAKDGDVQEVWMAHKGGCLDKAEAEIRADGKRTGWQELGKYLGDALHNAGLTPERMLAAKADDDEFGIL
ncbi:hypothetical protein ABID97_003641 [Variovorax sp. OAS795]|uniref:hypothetical protein n=1 Tax=Variovorax sp. OAS795 TaxID=3034231 RepID=UPI00339B12A7